MQLNAAGTLTSSFRSSSDWEAYQRLVALRRDNERREQRERDKDAQDAEAELLDFAVAMVTAGDIEAFQETLAVYDAATVAALQENAIKLEVVQKKLDAHLAKAYVLPDGRRVFKTEDGSQVFDEFGQEVDLDTVAPETIEENRPRWESYKAVLDEKRELTAERKEVLGYQEKLDGARERLDRGDLTQDEFDDLREELKADMPAAVRTQVQAMDPDADLADEPKAAEQEPVGEELDISDDMVPTRAVPTFG